MLYARGWMWHPHIPEMLRNRNIWWIFSIFTFKKNDPQATRNTKPSTQVFCKPIIQSFATKFYVLYPANTGIQNPKAAEVQQEDGLLNQESHPCRLSDQKVAVFDQCLCCKALSYPLCSLKQLCLHMHICVRAHHNTASQRTRWGTCFLLPPCGCYGSKSSFQEWQCCLYWQNHLANWVYCASNGQSSSLEGFF